MIRPRGLAISKGSGEQDAVSEMSLELLRD
jgi:hypothetical protein